MNGVQMHKYEPTDNPVLDVVCPSCSRTLQITPNEEIWEEIMALTWRCEEYKKVKAANLKEHLVEDR
jgi:hypothetical protein